MELKLKTVWALSPVCFAHLPFPCEEMFRHLDPDVSVRFASFAHVPESFLLDLLLHLFDFLPLLRVAHTRLVPEKGLKRVNNK